jgi:hypothetical protein
VIFLSSVLAFVGCACVIVPLAALAVFAARDRRR